MRRVAKLVHRLHALDAIAARHQRGGVAREGAGSQLTATTRGTPDRAISADCAAAPARGGSNTTASKAASSAAASGRLTRSRTSVLGWRSPGAPAAARTSAAMARRSLSTAVTAAASPRRSAKVPTPQNRSATRFAPATPARTRSASAASPASVACRKAPGGRTSAARPMRNVGARASTSTSPWFDRRARSSAAAAEISARVCASSALPRPRRSRSSPVSVAVTTMSSGRPDWLRMAATRRAAGSAPAMSGDRMGQKARSTMECARACMKPTRGGERGASSREWKVARRRPAPWASRVGRTGASSPALARAVTTRSRFQAR